MSVRPLSLLLVFALGVGTAGLVACGSNGSSKALIPVADAGPLRDDFDAVGSAISTHDCSAAADAVRQAQARVDSLPRSTSAELRQRLRDGLQELQRQAAEECVPPVDTTTDTTPTDTLPTDTLPTDTLPTDTLPTDTLPPDTVPTETVPADTTPATPVPTPNPGEGNDNGNGNAFGHGKGGGE